MSSKALKPTVSLTNLQFCIELPLPLGVGLTEQNLISELKAGVASPKWQIGDKLLWADGIEVRDGKKSVGDAIDRNLEVHTFIVQRLVPRIREHERRGQSEASRNRHHL